jgi:hypothetical protein
MQAIRCLVSDGTVTERVGLRGAKLITLADQFPARTGSSNQSRISEGNPLVLPLSLYSENQSQEPVEART